ncbi:MAG TPA: hypothetical protein VMR34_04025 [Candidatus Saccharimonadales bacterium]|jgi:hypothetical protein|nr:hypothetical protein [Candidatus Saccharimonadales bacterium]
MPNKKTQKKDSKLKAFIKSGGRKDAEAAFDEILKRATKPKIKNKSSKAEK